MYQFREQKPDDINRENNDDFQSRSRGHDTFYNRNNYRPIINQANPYRTNQQPVWQFQPHKQHVPQPNIERQSVQKQNPVRRKKNPCDHNPVGIYMFKVNRNTRTRCEICSKLTIKTPEQHQWRRSFVFIVNFEHISHFALEFPLLTLNM